jgi:hypothetical protein
VNYDKQQDEVCMARLSSAAHDLAASSGEFLSQRNLWREVVTEEDPARRSALASRLRRTVDEQKKQCQSLDEMLSLSVTIGILDFVEEAHVAKAFKTKFSGRRPRPCCVPRQE